MSLEVGDRCRRWAGGGEADDRGDEVEEDSESLDLRLRLLRWRRDASVVDTLAAGMARGVFRAGAETGVGRFETGGDWKIGCVSFMPSRPKATSSGMGFDRSMGLMAGLREMFRVGIEERIGLSYGSVFRYDADSVDWSTLSQDAQSAPVGRV